MSPPSALFFVFGSLSTYAIFLAIKYSVDSTLAGWQFHISHGLVALSVACLVEIFQRKKYALKTKTHIRGNPHARQFFINITIWSALAALVFPALQIPNTDIRLMIHAFIVYLAFSALVTVFNLITLES